MNAVRGRGANGRMAWRHGGKPEWQNGEMAQRQNGMTPDGLNLDDRRLNSNFKFISSIIKIKSTCKL